MIPRTASYAVAAAAALLSGCSARGMAAEQTLYHGFTLVDPTAGTVTSDAWLSTRGRVIEAIGEGRPPDGNYARVYDVSGLFGMAGLIDAHGHITAGPQRITTVDGTPRIEITSGDEYSESNAALALAFGVTTIRNPGSSTTASARYDGMVESGEWIGPDALHAGSILQPPPFVGESFAYPQNPEEWDAEASRQAEAGMTYFKLYTDLSEDELASGVAAAEAHGLIPIAHLNGVSWLRAIELGVRQLEHALPTSPDLLEPEAREEYVAGPDFMTRWFELADYEGPLMRKLIQDLVTQEVPVDLTLLVNELIYHADDIEGTFPEVTTMVLDYMHPDFEAMLKNYEAMASVPAEQLARGRAIWSKVLELARVMHEAGVDMMIGTDGAGGGPWFARELHNHVRAGIPIWDVLRMATVGNAELMGLTGTGRIAPGLEADLVFLRADPTTDVLNVREVEMVVTNGEMHRPDDLLDIAREIAATARARAAD